MDVIRVKKAPRMDWEVSVPGDKSISHRAVLLSSLTNGVCEITNFLAGEDCHSTIAVMRALGITIEEPETTTLQVHGRRGELTAPSGDLFCGNSGTTMRLISGLLAGQNFASRLTGDPSLSRRPMDRIMTPLNQMGASIQAEVEGKFPPLRIEGRPLKGLHYELPVASAQVKSAILLAGLSASGRTSVTEPAPTRDHTERMLRYYLVPVRREGATVIVHGGQHLESRDFQVPGDISSAAFWMVAAAAQPGARLTIRNVGLNPTRTGVIGVLIRMGATIREVVDDCDKAEPAGNIVVHGGFLQAVEIGGEEIPNLIDELPILAVAAALANGTTIIRDARELRVKETDRLAALAGNLRKMGVVVREHEDGMEIEGPASLQGATLDSFGDHRIAMAFAIAGLFAKGETLITNAGCVAVSYPDFTKSLDVVMKRKTRMAKRS